MVRESEKARFEGNTRLYIKQKQSSEQTEKEERPKAVNRMKTRKEAHDKGPKPEK